VDTKKKILLYIFVDKSHNI